MNNPKYNINKKIDLDMDELIWNPKLQKIRVLKKKTLAPQDYRIILGSKVLVKQRFETGITEPKKSKSIDKYTMRIEFSDGTTKVHRDVPKDRSSISLSLPENLVFQNGVNLQRLACSSLFGKILSHQKENILTFDILNILKESELDMEMVSRCTPEAYYVFQLINTPKGLNSAQD
jgi:hypothetical protein